MISYVHIQGFDDSIIYSLSILGWTQEEIGETFELSQQNVAVITKKFNLKLISEEFESGLKPEKIAENHSLSCPHFWSHCYHTEPFLSKNNAGVKKNLISKYFTNL